MKLLYITNGITGPGGLERVLAIKASDLAKRLDYEVHILSLNEAGITPFYRFSDRITFHRLRVKGNPISYLLAYIKGIKSVIKKVQPDVISVCDDGLKGFFFPVFFGKKIPVIYERHASVHLNFTKGITSWKHRMIHFTMQKLAKNFDAFVVLTKGNLKEWSIDNLRVIPNPLGFYPPKSSNLEHQRIIAVGTHSPNKGYDLLLQAWRQVVIKFPSWKLDIFGKYDPNETYLKMAKDLQMQASVCFSPPVSDIQNEYLKSSMLVLSSRSEGFGMVLIEAMACGVPSIAFDCPHGPADIINHNEDGLLVENGIDSALADAMMQLMENEGLRKKMGAKAKENVKRYLPEKIVSQWDALFQTLCANKSK